MGCSPSSSNFKKNYRHEKVIRTTTTYNRIWVKNRHTAKVEGQGQSNTTMPNKKKKKLLDSRTQRMMLYIWPGSPNCRAVQMVAKVMNLDLEVQIIDILKGEHKEKAYLKINPEGTIPTLIHGDFILWESRPIIQYLATCTILGKRLYPDDPQTRGRIDRMIYYDIEKIYTTITDWLYPQVFYGLSSSAKRLKDVEAQLSAIETILEDTLYIAGNDLSIADFSVISNITLLELVDFSFNPWPYTLKWMNNLKTYNFYSTCNQGLEDWKISLIARHEMKERVDIETKYFSDIYNEQNGNDFEK